MPAILHEHTCFACRRTEHLTLTAVKEESPTGFRVEQTVATPERAKTPTLDSKPNRIYLMTAEYGPFPPHRRKQPHSHLSRLSGCAAHDRR
jgi:hypothetical protein